MRAHDLSAKSAASRGLVASPYAASLGHQTALGFVRRCSGPGAPSEASFLYSSISFSQVLLSRFCNLSSTVSAFLILTKSLGSRSPHFCTTIARLRLRRHPAKVRSQPLHLLWLLRQVRPSCGQGFHQTKLQQSFAQNYPPSCIPSQPEPVARLLRRYFPGHPPWRGDPALSRAHRSSMLVSCSDSQHRGSRAQPMMSGGKAFGAACTLAINRSKERFSFTWTGWCGADASLLEHAYLENLTSYRAVDDEEVTAPDRCSVSEGVGCWLDQHCWQSRWGGKLSENPRFHVEVACDDPQARTSLNFTTRRFQQLLVALYELHHDGYPRHSSSIWYFARTPLRHVSKKKQTSKEASKHASKHKHKTQTQNTNTKHKHTQTHKEEKRKKEKG